jgi:diaminohydroxyphosphoribosylaminopyrimidine deaminase/5-amino-6-(5-phosphoribosylamino)uracil reductase
MALLQSECAVPSQSEGRLPSSMRSADASHGDAFWMAEAVVLARAMQGRVWPNPAVGCVIVRDGEVVGRGQTQFGGRPHAERVALDNAGDRARGAALYVTLEPCCHWGKTPPCADAIIAAGITCVYAALRDPDPRVNGGGFRRLRQAGVRVEVGLAAADAREIMAGFFHRIATGQPLLTIGERPEPPLVVPNRFDAMINSVEGGTRLTTRSAAGKALDVAIDRTLRGCALLNELGKLGLTSVYLPVGDPLAEWFVASRNGMR